MNRLVIIGNGFDLAHGLKTGYNDFLLWYLKKIFKIAMLDGFYGDKAVDILFDKNQGLKLNSYTSIDEVIDHYYSLGNFRELLFSKQLTGDHGTTPFNPFQISLKSTFIENMISLCSNKNWVDIENMFYDDLKVLAVGKVANEEVHSLNASLTEIIAQLHEYMDETIGDKSLEGYIAIMNDKIKANEILAHDLEQDLDPHRVFILNFNYTSTVDKYIIKYNMEINHIHGKLNDISNPLIFGFGDETDTHYGEFETNRTKGLFTYIKTFWYLRTTNYTNLRRFIKSEPYQSIILGHSCGLSDRTLLKMVFEDPNCISVKIYHHKKTDGSNNYVEISYDIARHFTSKLEMRDKIVPFNVTDYMPQFK